MEVGIETSVFTRTGIERVIRYAFEYAQSRGRSRVTSCTKSNALKHAMPFWDEVSREVAADFPDIEHELALVDALAARCVTDPASLDVVVASNLFGDILTDITAAVAGSLGTGPSANLDPSRANPSLFQAIHGSAPTIAGKGIANPVAEILSVALMLEFLGEERAARATRARGGAGHGRPGHAHGRPRRNRRHGRGGRRGTGTAGGDAGRGVAARAGGCPALTAAIRAARALVATALS